MRRDLFEAGLNEAAGSLAASYGRWSFARSVERIRYSWRDGRSRQRRKGSERDSREAWILDDDLCWVQSVQSNMLGSIVYGRLAPSHNRPPACRRESFLYRFCQVLSEGHLVRFAL